jgi:hypothetical protein
MPMLIRIPAKTAGQQEGGADGEGLGVAVGQGGFCWSLSDPDTLNIPEKERLGFVG